jgi:hypothetical protein
MMRYLSLAFSGRRTKLPPIGKLVWPLLLLATAAGCSGLKDYPSAPDENLLVRTKTSGSLLTKVEAFVHVFRLRGTCDMEYLGTVKLDRDEIRTGIPLRQPTYLKFLFKTSPRLGGGASYIPYGVILTPQAGGQYTADVSYADEIYNVSVREISRRGAPARHIEREPSCP